MPADDLEHHKPLFVLGDLLHDSLEPVHIRHRPAVDLHDEVVGIERAQLGPASRFISSTRTPRWSGAHRSSAMSKNAMSRT